MEYIVFDYNGKQYIIAPGDKVALPGHIGELKKKIDFDKILLVVDKKRVKIGEPYIAGTKISGTVLEHVKGDKVDIFKYKAKSRYRRRAGHRQHYTLVQVDKITS